MNIFKRVKNTKSVAGTIVSTGTLVGKLAQNLSCTELRIISS
jgi:hypothetical protein